MKHCGGKKQVHLSFITGSVCRRPARPRFNKQYWDAGQRDCFFLSAVGWDVN